MLRPAHLHHQLVLVVSALMLLGIGLLGAYTVVEQSGMLLHSVKAQASTLARNVAISSGNPLLTDSLDVLEELARRSADFEDVLEIQILSASGQILAHVKRAENGQSQVVFDAPARQQPLPVEAAASAATVSEFPERHALVAWHPIVAGSVIGWVRVDYSTRSLNELRRHIWASTALVALVSVALCGAILGWFLNRPMRALQRATRFAVGLNHIGGQQLNVEGGSIEIASMGAALNEASARLHQQMLAIEDGMRQLRFKELNLQEQNECLNAIFSLSPDGLVTFNQAGRVQFVNQAFMRLTGLPSSQVQGQSEAQLEEALRAVSPEPGSFMGLAACFERGEHEGPALRLTVRHQAQERVLTLSGQCSESGAVSKVLYVCDITPQHRLDQMKSDFLSMAAHELRTPMTSIMGFTELMMARDLPNDKRASLLGRVLHQSQAMITILNELLDLARIEAKKGTDFDLRLTDLVEVTLQAVQGFHQPADRSSPECVPCDEPMLVSVDAGKLQQAIANVLSNAYKYSPNGGEVSVRFVHGKTLAGARVGVEIADRGMGMSPEHLARMGERFFRADKSGHIPGTGLGVSIVHELVQLMGGSVSIQSELGHGTCVTLWLPAVLETLALA